MTTTGLRPDTATLFDIPPTPNKTTGPTPETTAWCTRWDHAWSTYNPQMDRTWCRCGQRQADGKQPINFNAIHEIFHRCPVGTSRCSCYANQEREDRAEYERHIRSRSGVNQTTKEKP